MCAFIYVFTHVLFKLKNFYYKIRHRKLRKTNIVLLIYFNMSIPVTTI